MGDSAVGKPLNTSIEKQGTYTRSFRKEGVRGMKYKKKSHEKALLFFDENQCLLDDRKDVVEAGEFKDFHDVLVDVDNGHGSLGVHGLLGEEDDA